MIEENKKILTKSQTFLFTAIPSRRIPLFAIFIFPEPNAKKKISPAPAAHDVDLESQ